MYDLSFGIKSNNELAFELQNTSAFASGQMKVAQMFIKMFYNDGFLDYVEDPRIINKSESTVKDDIAIMIGMTYNRMRELQRKQKKMLILNEKLDRAKINSLVFDKKLMTFNLVIDLVFANGEAMTIDAI